MVPHRQENIRQGLRGREAAKEGMIHTLQSGKVMGSSGMVLGCGEDGDWRICRLSDVGR